MEKQLYLFSENAPPNEKLEEIKEDQKRLRKSIFTRYQKQEEKLNRLESLLKELVDILHRHQED